MKNIAILGSTGNIGTQILEIVDKYPDKLKVIALTANSNIELLKQQIEKYKPSVVGVADEEKAEELQKQVDIHVFKGKNALLKIAALQEYDTFVNSLVSLSGIQATLEAIRHKKTIALANKETLVAAGQIVMNKVKQHNVALMPIDSEHSALFQCLNGEKKENIHKLIITCSGGALRDKTKDELKHVTVEEALGHKTWNMGKKITIDSATLINKGFEVIEAMWLYDIPAERIDVVIHPESIIHSMIEYSDGSIIGQLSNPDMKIPIQYALSYPERWACPIKRFDFSKNLTFSKPDTGRFPCLKYAYEAARILGTMPAAMNAANDYIVQQFLDRKCRLIDIQKTIKRVMDSHRIIRHPDLEDIENTIKQSTKKAEEFSKG
ncbi:MAG: 1-deoxy-D-xylulose-5-phosphate reductoisomerase [Nanoarchaeota archaeon]|nr:1-deoxy-D-xylulose-5-phosphate reductoisomerase [Nanoarchaeota archaeon]